MSVDGSAVDATDASEVWVPPLDPRELHIIETVVEYSDGSVARAVDAMRAGASMIVKGTSSRGTLTEDEFSLFGFSAGHRAIDKACRRG